MKFPHLLGPHIAEDNVETSFMCLQLSETRIIVSTSHFPESMEKIQVI